MTVVIHRLAILILCLMGFYVRAVREKYIIYPKEELSFQERLHIKEELNNIIGPQGQLYTSSHHEGRPDETIRFWCAYLTETAYDKLRRDPRV